MARPSYVNASTGATDATGAWSHTSAVPASAGNVYILQVLQDGTAAGANQPTVTSVTNAEDLAGTDNVLTFIGAFPCGSDVTPAAYQHLWIGRALNTSAMVVTGANVGGDDLYVRVYEFTGVSTGTTLATVIENVTAGSTANNWDATATVSGSGVTTLGIDRLPLQFVAVDDDNPLGNLAAGSGGYWLEAVAEYADSGGTDGAIQLQAGLAAELFYGAATPPVTGGTVGSFASLDTKRAQSFVAPTGAANVVGVVLPLEKIGTPSDNLTIQIVNDSAGSPGVTVSGSATVSGSSLTTSFVWYEIALTAALTPSSTYWIVLSRTGAIDGANYYAISVLDPGTYANGVMKPYNGSVWGSADTYDAYFGIVTNANALAGGTMTMVAADNSGTIGFALTAAGPAPPAERVPRSPGVDSGFGHF